MPFLFIFFVTIFSFCSLSSVCAGTWTPVQPKKTIRNKSKVWQVQVSTHQGTPLIYLIQSNPAQIRIFFAHTKYHHPVSLTSFGLNKITDVGLSERLKGRGQVLYFGDQTTQRIFYLVLGKKAIREFPLEAGVKAYKEFIARLHPIAESERHF